MINSSAAYNRHIMNKMLWMSRNLRNFNDTVSISNWAHTMSILKNLLLPPLPPPAPQINRQPPPMQDHISEPVRSITPPHTICFQPAMKKPLSQSAPRCTINKYNKPSPLTTYTLSLPNIASTDFLPQPPKRRKLSIPPSVDYYAPTETPLPKSTATAASSTNATPGLGLHLWYRKDPKTSKAVWSRVKAPGTVEFKVVQTPRDPDPMHWLLNMTTENYISYTFSEDQAACLFQT